MKRNNTPKAFCWLKTEGCIEETDIKKTQDGFWLVDRSIADILARKEIFDFPDKDSVRIPCDRFYDDWFLYAVPDGDDHIYSLLKLREQEHDTEDGAPADGDTPGVTISFISFGCEILFECLRMSTNQNRRKLDVEINRVVAYGGQKHHKALKQYFVDPHSHGAYLVARLYGKHIAAFAENGMLELPLAYQQTVQRSISFKNSARLARLPRFIASVNEKAGRIVCDEKYLYIKDREHPDEDECAAILATHTGNTSPYSFAAEVEYHARYLVKIAKIKLPFFGRSVYSSAIRADMTIGDNEFQGAAPFCQEGSKILKRQKTLHQKIWEDEPEWIRW